MQLILYAINIKFESWGNPLSGFSWECAVSIFLLFVMVMIDFLPQTISCH